MEHGAHCRPHEMESQNMRSADRPIRVCQGGQQASIQPVEILPQQANFINTSATASMKWRLDFSTTLATYSLGVKWHPCQVH